MLVIHKESHTDHIPAEVLAFITETFKNKSEFFIQSIELPNHLPELDCGLHGPIMGDKPVTEEEVTYAKRNNRPNDSRIVNRPTRKTRTLTVIAGGHDGLPCVLYTAFGGPLTPKEPTDPNLKPEERAASEQFWREHALSK